MGAELLRRAIDDAQRRGGFDAIAVLGDVLDDGSRPTAPQELAEVRKALDEGAPGVPVLVAPGNHDGDPWMVLNALTQPGQHRVIGGYRFFCFIDSYENATVCTRPPSQRAAMTQAMGPEPMIVLQHNPMNPFIESSYPFMLTNRDEVLSDYERTGVMLSLSGHYHAGQPLSELRGVRYYTGAVLCEHPFRYAVATLRGRDVSIREHALAAPPELALIDCHAHTELAYCASDATAQAAVQRAQLMDLAAVCLAEHAPQLYCEPDDFWQGRHVREPAICRTGRRDRAQRLRDVVDPLRRASSAGGPRVLGALEVEVDADGKVIADQADLDWADVVLGAVHFMPTPWKEMSPEELHRQFWRSTRDVVLSGIDVLAHPLRYLQNKTPADDRMHEQIAEMLAATGTAAELNFHITQNDPRFFRACIRRGVKIALGSDAHARREVANFGAYLDFLREQCGVGDLGEVLWRVSFEPRRPRPDN